MIEHYFNKIDIEFNYNPDQLGYVVDFHLKKFPTLENAKIAIIGVHEDSNIVRSQLYEHSIGSQLKNQIVDLGNIAASDQNEILAALELVISELKELNIITIVLGLRMPYINALGRGLKDHYKEIEISYVSPDLAGIKKENDNHFFSLPDVAIKQIHCLAHQIHFVSPDVSLIIEKDQFSQLRLGELKNTIENVELYLRESQLLLFDINAIKTSCAPGKIRVNPSGLNSDEACQIARYAGMSDDISCFGLWGFEPSLDARDLTASLCAQILWYYLDGMTNRKNDKPKLHNEFVKYRCDFSEHNTPILFLKSKRTSRWWMKIEHPAEPENSDLAITIPCSYDDYMVAANGETPERYLNALKLLK